MTDYTVHPINWTELPAPGRAPSTSPPSPATATSSSAWPAQSAADDPWLVTGDDAGRFRFEIITSGTETMNLQATGGEGRVNLTWTQNDFDLLAGFNLYRATSQDRHVQPHQHQHHPAANARVHRHGRDARASPTTTNSPWSSPT